MFAHELENRLAYKLHTLRHADLPRLLALIDEVEKHPDASLFAIDKDDENFLHYALRHSEEYFLAIYDRIKYSENSKKLIGMPNKSGASLFSMCMSWLNKLNLASTLFNDYELAYSLDEAIKVFFLEKNDKTTVLHEEASKMNLDAFDFILSKLKNARKIKMNKTRTKRFFIGNSPTDYEIPETISAIVNQKNACGNTPLHCLVLNDFASSEQIAYLVNCGANLFIQNQNNKRAFALLHHKKSPKIFNEFIRDIFKALTPSKQSELLDYFDLTQNPMDETLKSLYFELCSSKSLQMLTKAHLQFNDEVPLSTGYQVEERIPSSILYSPKIIPFQYRQKILEIEKTFNKKRMPEIFTPEMGKTKLTDLLWRIHNILVDVETQFERFNYPLFKLMATGWESQRKDTLIRFEIDTQSLIFFICAIMCYNEMDVTYLLIEAVAMLLSGYILNKMVARAINELTDEKIKENLGAFGISVFFMSLIILAIMPMTEEEQYYTASYIVQVIAVLVLASKSLTQIGQKIVAHEINMPESIFREIKEIEDVLENYTNLGESADKIKSLLESFKSKEAITSKEVSEFLVSLKEMIDLVSQAKNPEICVFDTANSNSLMVIVENTQLSEIANCKI